MSLDVYLKLPDAVRPGGPRIFIREDGANREITREEWDRRFPDREPVTALCAESDTVFTANITHNLNTMAEAADLYQCLWRPHENGITRARQLIDTLTLGLDWLRAEPDHFRTFNPKNGWGTYEGLVAFVEAYLAKCHEYPDAEVSVSV